MGFVSLKTLAKLFIGIIILSCVFELVTCSYPASEKFLKGCNRSEASSDMCWCMWKEVKSNYSIVTLQTMDSLTGYLPDDFEEVVTRAAEDCQHYGRKKY